MSNKKDAYPTWFLWIFERGLVVGLVLLVLAFVVIFWVAQRLDERLGSIEDRLSQSPPKSFQDPDLSVYEAKAFPDAAENSSRTIYVPIYSHVYYNGGMPFSLESTLSVRNVNQEQPIFFTAVDYYDTQGDRVKQYLDRTITLAPMQTIEFLVPARDSEGGSGANFLVNWFVESGGHAPVIEAVMVGSIGTQAISFLAEGRELD